MANIPVVSGQFSLTHNVDNSGTKSILLSTANTFVDKNIGISIVTPSAQVGTGSASTTFAVNNTDGSAAGINIHSVLSNTSDSEPESGYYVSVDITSAGHSTIDRAGWVDIGDLTGGSNAVTKYISIDTSTVTTSYTNSGMSTYFTSGTSSNKNVTITPKYTITAGYSPAVTTATNSGGTGYWKIKTATPVADTANVVLYTTDGSNAGTNIKDIVGTAQDTEPNTSGSYYLAFTGSGNSKTTADGWVTAGSFAAASKTKYFPITAAEGTITGTNTVSPSASLDGTNVTLSDTNNGIYITATGGGTASVTAQANITTAGYLPSGNNLFSAALNASSNTTTATKYISGITLPKAKSFAVTLTANTTTDNSKLTVTNNAYRNVEISNKGNVTITHPTSGSGNVSVTPNGGSSTQVISGGAMVTTSVNTSATTTVSGTNATRATATWGDGWISSGSIDAATFGNAPASGKTADDYVNISATTDAPVLIAGSYLYINKGFVDNLKISLAKLIPDTMGTGEEGFAAASYILQGYVAFNGEGERITGTIPTYQGAYSVS